MGIYNVVRNINHSEYFIAREMQESYSYTTLLQ